MDLIVAADKNCAVGANGKLLFSIPEDMKYFRRMTTGKVVVMGRKTLESFPGGKPLPNRTNIVLSSSRDLHPEGATVVRSLDELFREIAKYPPSEVMLIGGGSLYGALYPACRRAYVTWVDAEAEGADTFIPDFRTLEGWSLESESEPVETNGYVVRFAVYVNASPQTHVAN